MKVLLVIRLLFLMPLVFTKAFASTNLDIPSKETPRNFDYGAIDNMAKGAGQSVITAIVGDPKMRGTSVQREFFLEKGDKFGAKILINNNTSELLGFFLVGLVDYSQVRIKVDGVEVNKLAVKVKPREQKEFVVLLPRKLTEGFHDILFLFIRNNVRKLSYAMNNPATPYPVLSIRSFVQVGNSTQKPLIEFGVPTEVKGMECNSGSRNYYIVEEGDRKSNKSLLRIINADSYMTEYAFIIFEKGKQSMFSTSDMAVGKKEALYLRLLDCQEGSVGIEGFSSNSVGIMIENPFVKLEGGKGEYSHFPTMVLTPILTR